MGTLALSKIKKVSRFPPKSEDIARKNNRRPIDFARMTGVGEEDCFPESLRRPWAPRVVVI
jgi:hypothetical protein